MAERQGQGQETNFLIQISGTSNSSATPESAASDFIEGSRQHFEDIAQVIEAAGHSFVDRLNEMATKPAECAIEFGVNVGGEAGIPFVTKGSVGANFKVTIKWVTAKEPAR